MLTYNVQGVFLGTGEQPGFPSAPSPGNGTLHHLLLFFNQQSQPCVIAYYLYLNFQRTPVVSFLIVFLLIKNTANGRNVELASTPCLPAGVRSPLGADFPVGSAGVKKKTTSSIPMSKA